MNTFSTVLALLCLCAVAAIADFPTGSSARWIWIADNAPDQWVAFRKSVVLPDDPETCRTCIAVDSKYWLYVNGELVVFEGGLKRGPNRSDTYHDVIDLAPYLHAGSNSIALLVWHFGRTSVNHFDSGSGGLLYHSAIVVDGNTNVVVSDPSWSALAHPGYSHQTTGTQPRAGYAEWNVYYNAVDAEVVEDWPLSGFDDSSWPNAVERGGVGAAPWNALVERPVPLFRFSDLREYVNAADFPTNGAGNLLAEVPSNLQVTAYLKVDAPANQTIGIQTDYYTDGGEPNVRAVYTTKDGVQEFEWLAWCSGTKVIYNIPSSVRILSLKYRESGFDSDFVGHFTSDDSFANAFWEKAARTDYVCMRDNHMDCPTRERNQWWGDIVNEMKQGFYLFDTNAYTLVKKGIGEMVGWVKPGGILASPAPGGWQPELPSQSLAMVWSFWTYYWYTGDASPATAAYTAARNYLNVYTLDEEGLVQHREGDWAWYDWYDNIDTRVMDNALYYLALESTIQLAELTGNASDLPALQSRKQSLEENFNRVFWDSVNHEYRSPGYTGATDERGHALAVVAGLVEPGNLPYVRNILRRYQNGSPYAEIWALEALYQMDSELDAQDRMTRFEPMVNAPTPTLWEYWHNGASKNHAWAGGAQYALSAYAGGVRPTAPGYSNFVVRPQMGRFARIDALVPTPRGNISAQLTRQSPSRLEMEVESPDDTTALIGVPTSGMISNSISANGTLMFSNNTVMGTLPGLTYESNDVGHVYFSAAPGQWTFIEEGLVWPNVALYRPVNASSTLETSDWSVAGLTDGKTTSLPDAKGYTSEAFSDSDVSANPISVTVDLGSDVTVSAVRLYPRTDMTAARHETPGFPVDFTIDTAPEGGSFSQAYERVGEDNPIGIPQRYSFAPVSARYVRLTATRLGPPADGDTAWRLQLAELTVDGIPTALSLLPPAKPEVVAGNSRVTLTWNEALGATAYKVYRATQSGGPYLLLANVSTTAYTDTQAVNGSTYYYVVQSVDAANEGRDSPEVSATPRVLSAAVNSGGDAAGGFAADDDFNGGSTGLSSEAIDVSSINTPAPEAVYQSERYGNFVYRFFGLSPESICRVRLHFAEVYWNAAGQRVFNVSVNGMPVLTNLDIFAATGGKNRAMVREFDTRADANGELAIQFTTVVDNAKVSGIELIEVERPVLSANRSIGSITLSWSASAEGFRVLATTNLSTPVLWSTVTNEVISESGLWMLTLPFAGACRFFRLDAL